MSWQPAAVEPVDVVLRASQYLRPLLPVGTFVGDVRPTEAVSPYPEFVVTLRRDGGPTEAFLDRPRVGVNVWGPKRKPARDLAAQVTRHLLGWPATLAAGSPARVSCVFSPSLVPDDDPPHFYATFEMTFRSVSF